MQRKRSSRRAAAIPAGQLAIAANSRLVMIGDSITDAGRNYDAWPGDAAGFLGHGYVAFVNALLGACHPERHIFVINKGVSGNTVRDLQQRWQSDVIAQKPDWLSVMIGINDVWRQFDTPRTPEASVPPGEFERTLSSLVAKTRSKLAGLVLMSPYFIEPNPREPMRSRMDEYGKIMERVAARHDAIFVDTQGAFAPILSAEHSGALAWDRVHPNATGHMAIARAFLRAVGVTQL